MQGITVAITDTGARPDTICTHAIQAAIDRVTAAGGGTVVVPAGHWVSGTLVLRSGLTLHVSPAAVLEGSPNLADYPPVGRTDQNFGRKHHFLYAEDAANLVITGGGTIDGNGPAFWDLANRRHDKWIPALPERVSPMIQLTRCRRVTFDNIVVRNSPGWTIHPYCCDDLVIQNTRIENDLFGPNTDGIDVNGCHDVFITNCKLTCGDDAIIIKASADARSTERVLISNCVTTTNCIGIGIAQEVESGVRQVAISNCVFRACQRMFQFASWNGGTIEDVVVTGCVGDTNDTFPLARPIHLEVKRHLGRENAGLGTIRNVQFSNIVARTAGRIIVTAQEPDGIEHVVFRDIRMEMTDIEDAARLSPLTGAQGSSQYCNQNLEARRQNAILVLENANHVHVDGLHVAWPTSPTTPIPYGLLWARRVRGGRIDLSHTLPHGGAPAAVLSDVAATVVERAG